MTISGEARLAGVMEWPVAHSRLPPLHEFGLERYGIDGGYVPVPVAPAKQKTDLYALPMPGFRGVNLTVPQKEAALRLCDEVDPLVRCICAALAVDEPFRPFVLEDPAR